MPLGTAYLERRDRRRGIGHHLLGLARHQSSNHVGIGARVCGVPPCRAEAYAASMICIIASASRNDATGFTPVQDSASTRFTNSGEYTSFSIRMRRLRVPAARLFRSRISIRSGPDFAYMRSDERVNENSRCSSGVRGKLYPVTPSPITPSSVCIVSRE